MASGRPLEGKYEILVNGEWKLAGFVSEWDDGVYYELPSPSTDFGTATPGMWRKVTPKKWSTTSAPGASSKVSTTARPSQSSPPDTKSAT